ncbi:MAG: UDP-N-acetylglucosamine 2-epimerase (non-hydrolyzing) [Cytophagales bacterium]|jgi:UDP-N-acetylglucosamine 2-epimerase (non-hydrolysing)|nr:UDP-N-acetylglucosamine 2-epimerase (non-hydrolyzing) [Cytophagales bacterium]MCA6388660.1 UDP-N-acetylglucosamine 2-epimerase (non-hydrolyzing) [Cytophagales bacterium]MCA6393296.1 UDP-N-acetylglucosamine 2-epimerase (non-hydrolyzing) [Cytophagales bacterium]MCA6396475.1 UDP-N-acetylglucosamine 2-epimerase (non-hydrolyzing) [Cytophagales bacterium]MCA6398018.1 UDP-N-acetylglucosamine 2-epimerase (non-hydrolyzing) [Cytophagales bacterium]
MRIDIIAGARPNFMKIAPIIDAIRIRQLDGSKLSFRLVHTGQHYDKAMSGRFFEELNIPDPDINLEVGSGTQAEQTGNIMVRYEKLLMESPCDLCLVVGDVTSTMACSIAAKKLNIKVAHVEGGIRSFDLTMPEEINRMVTDSITDYFFTTSEVANQNLIKEGVDPKAIFFVGNTMIDTLLKNQSRFSQPSLWKDLSLKEKEYFIITLHRPSNVDEVNQLQKLLSEITLSAQQLPIIFPVHPRTRKTLLSANLSWSNLFCVDPLGYLEFNYLVKHAKAVITDSGGVTEETTVLGVPCMTLRTSTERPETVTMGTNELLGIDPSAIRPAMQKVFEGNWKRGIIPEKWDGQTAGRIVTALEKVLSV